MSSVFHHQPYAANIVELSTLRKEPPASIRVVGSQSGYDLRNRQVIPIDAGPDQAAPDVASRFHRTPSRQLPAMDGNDTLAFDHPVFDGFQFLWAAVGTLQNISINQAAGTEQGRHGLG